MRHITYTLTLLATTLLAAPLFASAAGVNIGALTPYSNGIVNLINGVLVPVLFAIAFLYFIWGVYKYFILGADNETKRDEGRTFILYGLIGFVVILSVWGLVDIISKTFGLLPGGDATNTYGISTPTI